MRALVVDADWQPRKGYNPTAEETAKRRVLVGSQVWRNPKFEIKDIPVPAPAYGEVLIKVKSCGICGSDTHLVETDQDGYIIFSGLTRFPCVLGHEFSGIVEETGPGVVGLKKGDLVAAESVMWCGMCQACRSGAPNQCVNVELLGLSFNGAFADYVVLNERYCWKINELADILGDRVFDIGALIEPVGCAYNGMFIAGKGFNPGSMVVVHGCGPIGLGAVALARSSGASMIIAFDVNDERLKIARQMGADFAYNSAKLNGQSPSGIVMELTGGYGAEVQVEAAGAASKTIPEMEKSLASQGKIIYLGRAAISTPMTLDTLVTGANSIVGARGHAGYGIFPYIIRQILRKKLDLVPMISSIYGFDEIKEALSASVRRNDSKIMIRV